MTSENLTHKIILEITTEDTEMESIDTEDITDFICEHLNNEFYKDGLSFEPVNDDVLFKSEVKEKLFKLLEKYQYIYRSNIPPSSIRGEGEIAIKEMMKELL